MKQIIEKISRIIGLLCLIYGGIVRAVGSGTAFFIAWIGMACAFFFLSYALAKGWWDKLPGLLRRGMIGCLALLMIIFLVFEGMVVSGFTKHGEADMDAMIVLGAQVYKDRPSAVLKSRLDEAIRQLDANPNLLCVVTGGQGYNEPYAEAIGMAKYLIEEGVPEEKILLETEARTTEENIANSILILENELGLDIKKAKIGIVTNNFHVFRGLQMAKYAGIENACGISCYSPITFLPNNMFREFFGEIKFLLTSRFF